MNEKLAEMNLTSLATVMVTGKKHRYLVEAVSNDSDNADLSCMLVILCLEGALPSQGATRLWRGSNNAGYLGPRRRNQGQTETSNTEH